MKNLQKKITTILILYVFFQLGFVVIGRLWVERKRERSCSSACQSLQDSSANPSSLHLVTVDHLPHGLLHPLLQLVGRLVLPGGDGIPNVGGQLHWKSSIERHSSKAGLLVESLPELAASGDGFESLANILSEDWNDGRPCISVFVLRQ